MVIAYLTGVWQNLFQLMRIIRPGVFTACKFRYFSGMLNVNIYINCITLISVWRWSLKIICHKGHNPCCSPHFAMSIWLTWTSCCQSNSSDVAVSRDRGSGIRPEQSTQRSLWHYLLTHVRKSNLTLSLPELKILENNASYLIREKVSIFSHAMVKLMTFSKYHTQTYVVYSER